MDKAQVIKTTTEELLVKMITTFEVEVEESEGAYQIIIKTEADAPTIIGRHGETIRALQKILEVMLYKTFSESVNVLVNVNDYREKQRERLEHIADEVAQRVTNEKRESSLRSFSSFERRIIHEYISKNYPDLTSYSVGEGRDRRLMVNTKEAAPKEEESKE